MSRRTILIVLAIGALALPVGRAESVYIQLGK